MHTAACNESIQLLNEGHVAKLDATIAAVTNDLAACNELSNAEKVLLSTQVTGLKNLVCQTCRMVGHSANCCWLMAQMKDRSVNDKVRGLWQIFVSAQVERKRDQKAAQKLAA